MYNSGIHWTAIALLLDPLHVRDHQSELPVWRWRLVYNAWASLSDLKSACTNIKSCECGNFKENWVHFMKITWLYVLCRAHIPVWSRRLCGTYNHVIFMKWTQFSLKFPHSHDLMFVHALFKSDKLAHALYTSLHLHTGSSDWWSLTCKGSSNRAIAVQWIPELYINNNWLCQSIGAAGSHACYTIK